MKISEIIKLKKRGGKFMRKVVKFFLGLFLIVSLTACSSIQFNGRRIGNDSQLIMKYSMFNGTDFQLLTLEKGDIVDANIVSDSGKINIKVQKDDEIIYEEEDVQTGSFQLSISEDGEYKFVVIGKKAKGSVSFIKQTDKE